MKKYRKNTFKILFFILAIVFLSACGHTPKTIEISGSKPLLFTDEEIQLTATVTAGKKDQTSKSKIIWSSSDISVAFVSQSGTVIPIAPGTATLTATLANDSTIYDSTDITVGLHVKSITVPKSELTLLTGSAKKDALLNIEVSPKNAYYQDFIIDSSNPSIVTASPDGTVHAKSPGSAIITIASSDPNYTQTLSCKITVQQGVSRITLSENSIELHSGETHTLIPTIIPQDAYDQSLVWSSSDETIATVTQDGKITPVSSGVAEIRCTALDGSEVFGSCSVNVVIPVKQIKLPERKITLLLGGTEELTQKQLLASVLPENTSYPTVRWVSSDPSIVTVTEDGVATGINAGTATITAYSTDPDSTDRIFDTCEVSVGTAVQSISISGADNTMSKASYASLSAAVFPEDALNPQVVWTSSNEKVIKIDSRGRISAIGVGEATITCTAQDGSNISDNVTIKVIQAVTSLRAVETGNIVLFEGNSSTLHVNVLPEDASNKNLLWSSDNNYIAAVDSSGTVTAKNAGKTTITATAKDGSNRKCVFYIVVEPSVPVTLESLGFGVYNANLLGITVKNMCSTKSIRNFDFNISLISYYGTELDSSGSYSLGSNVFIGPNATTTIKRTLSGISWTQKLKITITGVEFTDGTYYTIPLFDRETWSFTR